MRGQASVEFLFLIGVLMMILAVFLWSDMSLQNKYYGIKTKVEAQKLCDEIAFEVNTAVRAGDGYKREFYMEKDFFGVSDFDISVGNYSVFIDWEKGSTTSSIIIKNITGTVTKEWNMVENRNGNIYVT